MTDVTYDATWDIAQSGRTANVSTRGNCPPYTADVEASGIVARFRAKECPPDVTGAISATDRLEDGTLNLSGDTLDATMVWSRELVDVPSGHTTYRCRTDTTARLTRTAR